jgi:CubicO group peptidase (beta-lactamase class C family)
MRYSLPKSAVFALVLFISTICFAQKESDTQWVADASQATRIQHVETGIPAVVIPGEEPVSMTLQQWMEFYKIPGLSLVVFDDYKIVWKKTYGVKQAGAPDKVTLNTIFQAGSISKPVTAMAVMKYVQAGRFSLDENINDKLVSWKLPDNDLTKEQKVTLRRLLSHSAGTTVHGFPGYAVGEAEPTLVQVLNGEKPANTAPVRVDLLPGKEFRYSGGGTTIVQLMLVDQLKKPFPQIMQETVLGPLGLAHSSYEQPQSPQRAAIAASGHRGDGKMVEGKWHIYPEMAAAGLWTTPTDLAMVAIEMAKSKQGKSNKVLTQATTKEMLTIQADPVGIGFFLDKNSDQFGHGGADEGFQANLIAYSDSGKGYAVMANSDNGFMIFDRLAASVAKEYGWTSFKAGDIGTGMKLALIARLKGTDRALAVYKQMRTEKSASESNPSDLNSLGYMVMRDGSVADAIKVFEANVALYPQDANAYDSLGEGYMNAGRKDEAIANYKKSLELNPKNDNGIKMLEKLGVKWTPAENTPR